MLLIAGIAGFYLYDVIWLGTPFTKNLFRTLLLIAMLLCTLIRIVNGFGRRSLDEYERIYEKELGYAFKNKPFLRKQLVCACRYYNESNYRKALKTLFRLYKKAESERDGVPILLFIAVCYSDMGLEDVAIKFYYKLLEFDPSHAQAHSNLGCLFMSIGENEMAIRHFDASIEFDPAFQNAFSNRATCYFRMNDFESAIADAKRALELKNNHREAANLLAIMYAMQGDEDNKRKYYHIAITSGADPEKLDSTIERFMHEIDEDASEDAPDEEE